MDSDRIFRVVLGFGIGIGFDVVLYFMAISWIGGGDGVYSPFYFLIAPFGFGFVIWPIAGALVLSFSSNVAMYVSAGMLVAHHIGFVVQTAIWNVELARDVEWMWWMRPGYALSTMLTSVAWPAFLWVGIIGFFWMMRKHPHPYQEMQN